jgi:hypothetical protein
MEGKRAGGDQRAAARELLAADSGEQAGALDVDARVVLLTELTRVFSQFR